MNQIDENNFARDVFAFIFIVGFLLAAYLLISNFPEQVFDIIKLLVDS